MYDMPEDDDLPNGSAGHPAEPGEEAHSLLRSPPDDPRSRPSSSTESLSLPKKQWRPSHPKRQSSLSHPRPDGTPRTTNRVRFDVIEPPNGHVPEEEWMDDEDYLHSPRQDVPLLTDITPPSQSPFLSDAFQPEDHLPNARPKSSTRSAIMNMANSIIGAGETHARSGRPTLINCLSRYHWPAICVSTGRPDYGHHTAHQPHSDCRLDHQIDHHQLQVVRHRLLPRHDAALLWQEWLGCNLCCSVGIRFRRHDRVLYYRWRFYSARNRSIVSRTERHEVSMASY